MRSILVRFTKILVVSILSLCPVVSATTPRIDSISPSTVRVGVAGVRITLSGANFWQSVVRVDGVAVPTHYQTTALLTADLADSLMLAPGTHQVTVYKTNLGKVSNSVPFTVQSPSRENAYCAPGDIWTGVGFDGPAALPRSCVYTGSDGTPSPGRQTTVLPGRSVTAALESASCGDTILLSAGNTYPPFELPAKNCDPGHWITIRSDAGNDRLPAEGMRMNPSYAGVMILPDRPVFAGGVSDATARIATHGSTLAIDVEPGANYYRIGPGLEVTRTEGSGYTGCLVRLSGSDHVVIDRDWIHGSSQVEETTTGVNLGGATNAAVIGSYLNDFKCLAGIGRCTDAHAIAGSDSLSSESRTWKIVNNFIEASGENILFGGALQGLWVPTDIEIRQNHLYKPPSWFHCTKGVDCYIAKNLFEVKNGSNILFEGNLLEYSWGGYSQTGFAILLTPRGKWARDEDITLRFNHISHVGNGLSLIAVRTCDRARASANECPTAWVDSSGAGNWSVHDLLIDDVQGANYLGSGTLAQVGSSYQENRPLHDVVLDHLTFVGTGKILSLGSQPLNPEPQMGAFTFTNNIMQAAQYSIWSLGKPFACVINGDPVATFESCFTASTNAGNLIVDWPVTGKPWPAGNQQATDFADVFLSPLPSGGDYHVLPPYQKGGIDGKDIGVDLDALSGYLRDVE